MVPRKVAHLARIFATAEICERRRRASKQAKDASIQSAVLQVQLFTAPERAKDSLHPGTAHAALHWTAKARRCGFYTGSTSGPGMWNNMEAQLQRPPAWQHAARTAHLYRRSGSVASMAPK